MICLTLTGKTSAENAVIIKKFRESIDLVEVRLDFLQKEILRDLRSIKVFFHFRLLLPFGEKVTEDSTTAAKNTG